MTAKPSPLPHCKCHLKDITFSEEKYRMSATNIYNMVIQTEWDHRKKVILAVTENSTNVVIFP